MKYNGRIHLRYPDSAVPLCAKRFKQWIEYKVTDDPKKITCRNCQRFPIVRKAQQQ